MKLSDYVMGRLADWGVRHIFLITHCIQVLVQVE